MKQKLLVIYYHEVVAGEGCSYQKLQKDKFESQMRWLKENGWQPLTFSQLTQPLPDKAVIVSFDDGFRSVFDHAAPIMEQLDIPGNVYLPTAYIGADPRFLTWDMARTLCARGWEMQAHTHTHGDIRTMDEAEMKAQVEESDRCFARELDILPEAFCMPFGTYDRASLRCLRNLERYRWLLGSHYGRGTPDQGTVLPRIGISNDDTIETFAKKLAGGLDWKGPLQRLRLFISNLRKQRITKYDY